MAAAQYWRVVGAETWGGGDLELSELQLHDASGRVDPLATLSCTAAPVSGALAALNDNDTGMACRFSAADVRAAGFELAWDFGAASADVVAVRLGSGAAQARFAKGLMLQSSADGLAWTTADAFSAFSWPGPMAMAAAPIGAVVPTTWSSTDKHASVTLSNGNLTASARNVQAVRAVHGRATGRVLFECVVVAPYAAIGVGSSAAPLSEFPGGGASSWSVYAGSGNKYHNGVASAYAGGEITVGSVVTALLDRDAGTLAYWVNGDSKGVAFSGLPSGELFPMFGGGASFADAVITANFGATAWTYLPPAGYGPIGPVEWGLNQLEYDPARPGVAEHFLREAPGLPAAGVSLQQHHRTALDVYWSGRGQIIGTIKEKNSPANTPLQRRVRLIDERSGIVVQETWSHPATGGYAFLDVDPARTYSVVAYDHAHAWRAVIADHLTLANGGVELMP